LDANIRNNFEIQNYIAILYLFSKIIFLYHSKDAVPIVHENIIDGVVIFVFDLDDLRIKTATTWDKRYLNFP
jgi:hypothetical protein